MSKGFAIADILGGQARQDAPAGQKMQIVMLPAADIEPNPENSIYEIGDVSMLKADIAERGLRSPLEVLPARAGKYMLLAGHRRWTACRELTAEGVTGFDVLPCVIHTSAGADDDLIALITSNATARKLTDSKQLRQYIALKQALEQFKAEAADKKAAEKQRADDAKKWLTMARRELENFDNWPIVDKNTRLGFTVRGRQMSDGGQLVVAVDETARCVGQVLGLPYRECMAARFDANGQRVGRDGAVVAQDWQKRWYNPNGALEQYIAEDIKRAAMKQEG